MNETLFVNNKLTAKLTRQLEEVMILARQVTVDALVVYADAIVAAYLIGLLSFRGITPSCSPSKPDTRSSNPPRLAMPD